MTKEQIRRYQKELRDKLTNEDQTLLDQEIRRQLLGSEEYRKCSRLFTFISFRSEVDTHEIIRQALQEGKKVFVPRVEATGMEFYEINDLKGLIPSKFGVPEPACEPTRRFEIEMEKPEYDVDTALDQRRSDQFRNPDRYTNLMLMPGLAFDRYGNRIGYGAGYYDRYLSSSTEKYFHKIALAYGFQVMAELPSDEYDIRVDEIITPEEIIQRLGQGP